MMPDHTPEENEDYFPWDVDNQSPEEELEAEDEE